LCSGRNSGTGRCWRDQGSGGHAEGRGGQGGGEV